jgi:MOSC domain-containing protein YiiM
VSGVVRSVNVGGATRIGTWRGRPVGSGIVKAPVTGRVRAEGVNLEGDMHVDRRVHGGPDKAIYAYACEDAAWWADELQREIPFGMFGENLSTEGVDCSGAVVGERWRIGTVLVEVAQPRMPCFKLGLRFEDPRMLKRFVLASRPGAYLRIVEEGELGAGDAVELVDRPGHGVTMAMVSNAMFLDPSLRPQAAEAPELPDELRDLLRYGI